MIELRWLNKTVSNNSNQTIKRVLQYRETYHVPGHTTMASCDVWGNWQDVPEIKEIINE